MSTRAPPRKADRRRAAAAIVLFAFASAHAQTPPRDEGAAHTILAAGNDEGMWLARVGARSSQVFFRPGAGAFGEGRILHARIVAMHAVGDQALLILSDGRLYRVEAPRGGADQRTEAARVSPHENLPDQAMPIDVSGEAGVIYALVASDAAAQLSAAEAPTEEPPAESAPSTRPFDPGRSPLSIVRYDGAEWTGLAPCPPYVQPSRDARRTPHICSVGSELLLVFSREPGRIEETTLDLRTGRWSEPAVLLDRSVAAFWATVVSRVPTVVAVTQQDGEEQVLLLRRLGAAGDGRGADWARAQVEPSALPSTAAAPRYVGAFGFNQHAALVAQDAAGDTYVRFARIDGPPLEPTITPTAVFVRTSLRDQIDGLAKLLVLALIIGLLVGLFVFRRTSLMRPLELPREWAPAYTAQRALSTMFDFALFSVPLSLWLGVSWRDGLWSLASWAWGAGQAAGESLPDARVFIWWGGSAASYALYSLVCELAFGRTLGKLLVGLTVLSEDGSRPGVGQILVRNVLRPVELLPQFWILTLLATATRNRQRLGDLYARTVVARRAPRTISHVTRRGQDQDGDDGDDQENGRA